MNSEKLREKYLFYKDAAYAAYGGYRCTCCGEIEKRFLTLDHKNNDGHLDHLSRKSGGRFYRWLFRNHYPSGIQVMCWNCNCGKYLNGGSCPHLDKH